MAGWLAGIDLKKASKVKKAIHLKVWDVQKVTTNANKWKSFKGLDVQTPPKTEKKLRIKPVKKLLRTSLFPHNLLSFNFFIRGTFLIEGLGLHK